MANLRDWWTRPNEMAAEVFRGLSDGAPLSIEEALDFGVQGWNLRCNRCGSYGALWHAGERPGWGDLALCVTHSKELTQLKNALNELRQVKFEQPPRTETDKARQKHRARRHIS